MKSKYLKMDCHLKRWGKTVPITFLIDAGSPAYPTVVYDKETYRSLMGRKVTKPRPLKATAYSFAHLEDADGNVISEKVTQTGEEAGEFAAKVLNLAVPISEEDYIAALNQITWPAQVDKTELPLTDEAAKEGMSEPKRRGKDADEKAVEVKEGTSERDGEKGSGKGWAAGEGNMSHQGASLSEGMRRKLALELIDSAERMNNEALKLLKSARLLLE